MKDSRNAFGTHTYSFPPPRVLVMVGRALVMMVLSRVVRKPVMDSAARMIQNRRDLSDMAAPEALLVSVDKASPAVVGEFSRVIDTTLPSESEVADILL